jgi:hypothetical protein
LALVADEEVVDHRRLFPEGQGGCRGDPALVGEGPFELLDQAPEDGRLSDDDVPEVGRMGAVHLDAGLGECPPQQGDQVVPPLVGQGRGVSRLLEDLG